VLANDEAGADVLAGPAHAGINGVEVYIPHRLCVARDVGAPEKVDVVEGVYQSGDVVEVGGGGLAVATRFEVYDFRGGAACAHMHPVAANFHVVFGVLPRHDKALGGAGDDVFDEGAGEVKTAVFTHPATSRRDGLNHGRNSIGKALILHHIQHGVVDALHFPVGEGLVLSTYKARADGFGPGLGG